MTNEFFLGSSIPNPGTIEPLERKFPKELAGTEVMDFLKVLTYFHFLKDLASKIFSLYKEIYLKNL
jgi:hypothetical protein